MVQNCEVPFFSCHSHLSFILFPELYYKLLDKYDLYYSIQHILLGMTLEMCLLLTSTLTVWHSRTRSRGDRWTHRRLPLNIRKHCKGSQTLAEVTQTGCVSLWDTHKSSGCGLVLGDPPWTRGLDWRIPRDQPHLFCSSVVSTHSLGPFTRCMLILPCCSLGAKPLLLVYGSISQWIKEQGPSW